MHVTDIVSVLDISFYFEMPSCFTAVLLLVNFD